jgi:hypothetical protein
MDSLHPEGKNEVGQLLPPHCYLLGDCLYPRESPSWAGVSVGVNETPAMVFKRAMASLASEQLLDVLYIKDHSIWEIS